MFIWTNQAIFYTDGNNWGEAGMVPVISWVCPPLFAPSPLIFSTWRGQALSEWGWLFPTFPAIQSCSEYSSSESNFNTDISIKTRIFRVGAYNLRANLTWKACSWLISRGFLFPCRRCLFNLYLEMKKKSSLMSLNASGWVLQSLGAVSTAS